MDVAVFRNDQDQVFALLDRCPHKGGPLSQGIVFGTSVACPLHNWTIGLDDGCAKAPDEGCTHQVRVQGRGRPGPARPGGTGHPGARPGSRREARPGPGCACAPGDGRRSQASACVQASRSAREPQVKETRSTCPYCGVGCGVIIESRGRADHRRARRPGPSGQLRPPVHQGLHAAPDGRRRRSPGSPGCCIRCGANTAARRLSRVSLGRRAGLRRRELRPGHPRTRARCGRLLHLRPVADRGLLRLQQAGQGPDRHQQRRHQLAPVHEQRGGRLQDDAGRRRAAHLLRRREPRAVHLHRRQQHGLGAPDPVPADRGGQGRQPADEDHRLRPAPHRHGRDRRPVPAASSPAPT